MRVVIMAAVAGVTLLVAAVVIVAGGSGGSGTTSTGTSDLDGMASSTDASKAAGAAEGEPVEEGAEVTVDDLTVLDGWSLEDSRPSSVTVRNDGSETAVSTVVFSFTQGDTVLDISRCRLSLDAGEREEVECRKPFDDVSAHDGIRVSVE